MSDRIETLTARLTAANATAAILTAQCDALDKRAADRHWTETDSAIGSGIRRKPNAKADARRYAGYSRDAQVYADRSAAESAVRVLESQLAYAIAERVRVRLTRDDILGARFVRSAAGWAKVRRVNTVTVSVDSGYSWADKIPFGKILEVKS